MPSIHRLAGALALAAMLATGAHAAASGAAPSPAGAFAAPVSVAVSTVAGLNAALAAAPPNARITLAPGVYPGLVIKNLHLTGVTISSMDAIKRAVIVGGQVAASSGITFTGVDFESVGGGYALTVNGSSDIHLADFHVYSTAPAATAQGTGFGLFGDDGLTVTGGVLHNLGRGMVTNGLQHFAITNNSMHDIRSDGIDNSASSHGVITGNECHDFYPAPLDHPDCMAFYTTGTLIAEDDLTFRDNLAYRGAGAVIQGLFIKDDPAFFPALGPHPYTHLVIDHNLTIGEGYNAIAVAGATSPVITNNEVDAYDKSAAWIRTVSTTGLTLTGNIADVFAIAADATQTSTANTLAPLITPAQGAAKFTTWQAAHPKTPR
jgi:hypothetical protein